MSDAKQQTARTVEFRGGGFTPQSKRWIGLVTFIVLIIGVEIGTRMGFISNLTVPRPSDVFATFVDYRSIHHLWVASHTYQWGGHYYCCTTF